MAKTKPEVVEQPAVSIETQVKELIAKKGHSIYEREPQPAFVGARLDAFVAELINLFN